ncbi:MAG: hypothetical protein ACI845_000113 [Gammaproteobacteria bacterium]|jgi:hypothetical protein
MEYRCHLGVEKCLANRQSSILEFYTLILNFQLELSILANHLLIFPTLSQPEILQVHKEFQTS